MCVRECSSAKHESVDFGLCVNFVLNASQSREIIHQPEYDIVVSVGEWVYKLKLIRDRIMIMPFFFFEKSFCVLYEKSIHYIFVFE